MQHEARRYLIVDDNLPFAENLAEILADSGAEADVTTLGPEALERAASTRYDALVSDMKMPVMSGAELVHRMRRLDPGLPAVVITAYSDGADLNSARHEGVLAVLPKPAPVGRLIELLGSARRDGVVAMVEDNPAMLDNMTEVLRTHGFTPVTATSVVETEQLTEVPPFAALVDLRVPGGADGVAMSKLAARFPGLPMLVVTAHADLSPPVEHEGLFCKPFETSALMEALERLHRSRSMARS